MYINVEIHIKAINKNHWSLINAFNAMQNLLLIRWGSAGGGWGERKITYHDVQIYSFPYSYSLLISNVVFSFDRQAANNVSIKNQQACALYKLYCSFIEHTQTKKNIRKTVWAHSYKYFLLFSFFLVFGGYFSTY